MKSKYEISIWDDVLSEDGKSFKEKKVIVIGSDTMTSEARAREPKMVTNINGTNKFTFNMYYSYIDTQTGERVKNPYIQYLINERKIKVLWKDQWYDLLIKQIKEDQVQHLFTYSCDDAYITELSRTGFELTFATELENNIGTARELVEKVIENTDWRFDEEGSDIIYQETEEPVYETMTVLRGTVQGAAAKENPNDNTIWIQPDKPLLVFYSYLQDINNLPSEIQVYYSGTNTWEQDENDMLVVNGKCCTINVTWQVSGTVATAYIGPTVFFRIDFANGVSKKYRAKRYVQSQKTIYNSILDRYVNVYNDGALLGYNTTEFNDALSVVNLVTNPANFKNTSGWYGEDLLFRLSPTFDSTTQVSTYSATSYLWLKGGQYIYNSGIQNNRPYIPNGFIEGERYVLRFKIKNAPDGTYIANFNAVVPSIQSRNIDYQPTGTQYFKVTHDDEITDHWLEYHLTCIKSCPYEMILSSSYPFGIFFNVSGAGYWLEEVQFYKEVYGEDEDGDLVRIDPESLSIQSVAQQYWKYFATEQPEGTTKDSLEYTHVSIGEWADAKPVYNNYQRYGTIEADNSNRFNILQDIAQTFECWVRFEIEHDEKGYIIYDDDLPRKWVRLKTETGVVTGIGFIYGVDLKSIVRNIKSDKISTKTIVEQNENEFGKNGFCSIARSEQNYPRENFIYNFDYYIQHGLLDKDALYDDLYNVTGYYSQLHTLNIEYAKNLELLTNKKLELTKQTATMTVYNQYISAAIEERISVIDSLMKLAGTTTESDAYSYAESHYRDTKVQSLIADRAQLDKTIEEYQNLTVELQRSLDALNEYITTKTARQNEIIEELRALNKWFYVKYSRFIQEGTWTSEDYWDDDLYYLDALQVAYESSRPQISYDISVLRLSDLPDYSSKVFNLGDISFIQDTEYFGYKDDKITPYKEPVVLTEITSYFDTPDKDVIKVQNYKSQFDDLFQRITASVQNLEFTQGKYAKAANIVASDGTIRSSVIQNTFNENKDLVYGAQNESATIDNTGITVIDNADAARQVKITSGGVFVTNDAGNTWKNAIRGDGISTDLLTAGKINTEEITVYNGDYPSFRWDPNGLNAYKFTDDGQVDTTQFVRFDQYGIYGLKNAPEVYVPTGEQQIYQDANFGLTWNKFFMKSTNGGKFIEISTERDIVVNDGNYDRVVIGRVSGATSDNYGIVIRNENNETVFQCDNIGSYLSGWTLTEDYLESKTSTTTNNNIRIYADGNIGCYAHAAVEHLEGVYVVSSINSFSAVGLNTASRTITTNETLYPFVSIIGKTKTQRQVSGQYSSSYLSPTSEYIPSPPTSIQIAVMNGSKTLNYRVDGLTWTVSRKDTTYNTTSQTIDKNTYYTTTYTYTFDLTAKQGSKQLFSIPYTADITETRLRYVPASNTKWYIDNNGDAIFHEIMADGGSIAGWWIDETSIYQTYDGTRNRTKNGKSNIKTELSSAGTATRDNFDYSIITDAINASMASIGGVLMSSGLINGYSIAQVAGTAEYALSMANSAYSQATTANTTANNALTRVTTLNNWVTSINGTLNTQISNFSRHNHYAYLEVSGAADETGAVSGHASGNTNGPRT